MLVSAKPLNQMSDSDTAIDNDAVVIIDETGQMVRVMHTRFW